MTGDADRDRERGEWAGQGSIGIVVGVRPRTVL